MKLKEKYHRLLTAKSQWQQFMKYDEYIPSSVCTEKTVDYLISSYTDWVIIEDSHCCYGWEKCCWQDVYDVGMWGMTERDVLLKLKSVLSEARYLSRRLPVFYLYERDNEVSILITYRHLDDGDCTDYRISGIKKG